MAPPKEEWQLWAYRFETELKKLNGRTDASFQSTEQVSLHAEQVKDLAISIDHLQEQHNTLQDRVRQLEQEASEQDQLNARKSQEQQKLESKNATLKSEFDNVLSAVEGMERLSRAEREQSKMEMQALRAQVEAFSAHGNINMKPSIGNGTPRASRAPSQATTVDDSLQLDVQLDVDTQAQPSNLVRHIRKMEMQGTSTLKDYLAYGDGMMQIYEAQAVKDFVNGMNEFARRKVVWDKLENVGWTWANAKPEIQKMVDGTKRRSKRRAVSALADEAFEGDKMAWNMN